MEDDVYDGYLIPKGTCGVHDVALTLIYFSQ